MDGERRGEEGAAAPDGLLEQISAACRGTFPFHMPGHKRNTRLAPYLRALRADLDVTEIGSLDNLRAPSGILSASMRLAALLYRAENSFFLVNGSTGGILAGMRALASPGDTALVARNCHISVFHALALLSLRPVFIHPRTEPALGIPGSLSARDVGEAIRGIPSARFLVLTSPTYEGVISDLEGICAAARDAGVKVLADEAHGAHLDLSPYFRGGAVLAGADIVVHSLHKTLPSLTQTGLVHVRGAELASRVAQELAVFQTSSPSWLLLASIDGCVRLLSEKGGEIFERWERRLRAFDGAAAGLRRLRVPGHGHPPPEAGVCFGFDRGKLLISCAGTDITGQALAGRLRREHRIETEMAQTPCVLAMTGPGDTEQGLLRLAEALKAIDRDLSGRTVPAWPPFPVQTPLVLPPAEAEKARWELTPLEKASGRVCAEYLTAYPPGIPLLIPGELVSSGIIDSLRLPGASESLVKSRSLAREDRIAVLA